MNAYIATMSYVATLLAYLPTCSHRYPQEQTCKRCEDISLYLSIYLSLCLSLSLSIYIYIYIYTHINTY